jgi:hypothetical protein
MRRGKKAERRGKFLKADKRQEGDSGFEIADFRGLKWGGEVLN